MFVMSVGKVQIVPQKILATMIVEITVLVIRKQERVFVSMVGPVTVARRKLLAKMIVTGMGLVTNQLIRVCVNVIMIGSVLIAKHQEPA